MKTQLAALWLRDRARQIDGWADAAEKAATTDGEVSMAARFVAARYRQAATSFRETAYRIETDTNDFNGLFELLGGQK